MTAAISKRAARSLDDIPAADLFTGNLSSAEVAEVRAEVKAKRVPYGQIRPAFDAMMHAAGWYAKLPWSWLDHAGRHTVALHEVDAFAKQVAEHKYERGGVHFALCALARGFELGGVLLRNKDKGKSEELMWISRLESIAVLTKKLGRGMHFVDDVVLPPVRPYLRRYITPSFIKPRSRMVYRDILTNRPGGGPDLGPAVVEEAAQ